MKKEYRFSTELMNNKEATMTQIITDTHTGVQYLLAIYPSFGAGLTVLLDAEGKPLVKK